MQLPDASIELPVLNLTRPSIDVEADISAASTPSDVDILHRSSYIYHDTDNLVMRRQPLRPKHGGGAKRGPESPARFANLTHEILDNLEFSGWGTNTRLDENDLYRHNQSSSRPVSAAPSRVGPTVATGIVGNGVWGSVFYAFPAVVSVSGVYSPIALAIACGVLFVFRPVMAELASALPINGANYAYLLNTASKSLALVGASLTLLDAATTATISAATFAAYLQGEIMSAVPAYCFTLILLVGMAVVCLIGLREVVGLAFAILCLHGITMLSLAIASTIHWIRIGNEVLSSNWHSDSAAEPLEIVKATFFGICVGVLGLTGFECAPLNIEIVSKGAYPSVLRNLHWGASVLNAPLMLLVFANLPTGVITSGANVLSVLAEVAAGRWLRIIVVLDAAAVLCGGILTGYIGVTALLEKLSNDLVLPRVFTRRLPYSRVMYLSIVSACILALIIYAAAAADLNIISLLFSLVFLADMTLYPIALLLLKHNRRRLPRTPVLPLERVALCLSVALIVIIGNAILNPISLAYLAAYVCTLSVCMMLLGNLRGILVGSIWILDQSYLLNRGKFAKRVSLAISRQLRSIRSKPVLYFSKIDSISHLVDVLRYIQENEQTANVKLCHVYQGDGQIPSELEANHRIVDEAYPAITVDLILIRGTFTPKLVQALSVQLKVPISSAFISSPGERFKPPLVEWGGVRIIAR